MTQLRWLLVAALLAACGQAAAPPTPSGATALPSSPPPASATARPLPSAAIARAALERAPEGSAITGIASGGPGFVAVGYEGSWRARVWLSEDGRSWSAAPDSETFADASMASVIAVGTRLIAVGRDTRDVDDPRAAAWISADATTWQRVDGGAALEDAQLVDLTVGGRGIAATIVAVGGIPAADQALIWTSVDGSQWRRVPAESTFQRAFLWTVEQSGTGFIAGGWRRTPEPSAAVWTSQDGERWTLTMLPGGERAQVRAIASVGTSLVAAGDALEDGRAMVWTSSDGKDWVRVPDAASFAAASIVALVPVEGGLLAFGGRGGDAAVWASTDGRSWEPVVDPDLRNAYITAAASSGRSIAAGGALQERVPGTGSFVHSAAAWHATR